MRPSLIITGFVLFLIFLAGAFYLFGPTNEIDNALGLHRSSMIECTLKWGQLAPFPNEINNFTIAAEGNFFTRTFTGSFSAQPNVIEKWLRQSSGVRDGHAETLPNASTKYVLKTGEGASYGEITFSADHTSVSFKVEWS
jgi:hypothetical protein